ncbi:hypothetical protein Pfo_001117 [Paulownia fortunei]|nr:hypothetical protein Pfo_001117 [Paulownia fortunei]
MELKNNDHLQILIGKTWDLHGRINEKINQNSFSFCSHCSNHGRYCVVAESSVDEREKMIAIRDSLKDVHNILIYLQRVKTSQKRQRDEASARLEESRKLLIERINQCPEKERKLDVLKELITFVGDGKTEFPWNFKWKMDEKIEQKNVNGISSFLVHTTRFGLEFVVIFASLYTSVKLCKSKQQNDRLQREVVAPVDSRMTGKLEFLLTDSDTHLDVLCGRG